MHLLAIVRFWSMRDTRRLLVKNMNEDLRTELEPVKGLRVYDLLKNIGYDVSDWSVDINGQPIPNPYTNTHRNSEWSLGGKGQPTVIFLWHSGIDWQAEKPDLIGSASVSQEILDRISLKTTPPGEKQVLRGRLKKTRKLREFLYSSYKHRTPLRVVMVAGTEVGFEFAEASSKATARKADPIPWYIHEFDGATGRYKIVRESPPEEIAVDNELVELLDPVDDPDFQSFIGELSETEREALIKVRVNQGLFRDGLIERWKGCSVTGCRIVRYLIAGHIKPWSQCESREERLTSSNGFLLIPNLDKAFDRGGISFDENLKIIISAELRAGDLISLNIGKNSSLRTDEGSDLLPYLRWHRERIFNG